MTRASRSTVLLSGDCVLSAELSIIISTLQARSAARASSSRERAHSAASFDLHTLPRVKSSNVILEELSYDDLAPCAAPEEVLQQFFHRLSTANAAKHLDLSAFPLMWKKLSAHLSLSANNL